MTPQPPAPPDTLLIDFDRAPGNCVITLDINALADALDLASDQNRITWIATRGERRIAAIVPVDVAEAAGEAAADLLDRVATARSSTGSASTPGGPGGSTSHPGGAATSAGSNWAGELWAGPGSGWPTRQRIPVTLRWPITVTIAGLPPATREWTATVLLHALPRVYEHVTIPAAAGHHAISQRVHTIEHPTNGSPPVVDLIPLEILTAGGAGRTATWLTANGWTGEDI